MAVRRDPGLFKGEVIAILNPHSYDLKTAQPVNDSKSIPLEGHAPLL